MNWLTFFYFIFKGCVQQFHQKKEITVKIGKNELKSTVEAECRRQLEVYISNARTRLKRNAVRSLNKSMQDIFEKGHEGAQAVQSEDIAENGVINVSE